MSSEIFNLLKEIGIKHFHDRKALHKTDLSRNKNSSHRVLKTTQIIMFCQVNHLNKFSSPKKNMKSGLVLLEQQKYSKPLYV